MPAHRSGPARRRPPAAAGVILSLLSVLALLLTLPQAAGAAVRGRQPRPTHPEQDWMGATVRAHEGGHRSAPATLMSTVEGVDVSSHNGNVPWSSLRNSGVRFAYAKATEGTSYTNPYFTQQYNGPYDAGMIRGAYHFALPDNSSGRAQANYFADHGGGWSSDGKTLPGVLDMEYNPYGSNCYGMSASALVSWIRDFSVTYHSRTGRDPVIYTSTVWWKTCTGNYGGFGSVNPLWIPRYSSSAGELPYGWSFHTFWQYTDTGSTVGDRDRFNGSLSRLQALADG
ncbi:lysozyme [Streptomyces sp. NPDC049577]|uniref:lysozyme n=1 Tax=Streptomyces sp. NPDC049577 TaxID=3155153 RepID=UPI0034138E66